MKDVCNKDEVKEDILILYKAILDCYFNGDYNYEAIEGVLTKYDLDKELSVEQ